MENMKLEIGQSFEVYRSKDGNYSLIDDSISILNTGLKCKFDLPIFKMYLCGIEVYGKPIAKLTITKIKYKWKIQ